MRKVSKYEKIVQNFCKKKKKKKKTTEKSVQKVLINYEIYDAHNRRFRQLSLNDVAWLLILQSHLHCSRLEAAHLIVSVRPKIY